MTVVDLRNNTLTGYNILLTDAGEANPNVTLRLSGNPICTENFIPDRLQLKYCFDQGNRTVGDNGTVDNGMASSCDSCELSTMAVVDSPGQCRCAQPIEMEIQLKSPSFSFFNRFPNEFYGLSRSR